MASGFVIALALALLSYVRVSADGLTYRNPEVWSNEATLQLSDPSHPELRSKLPPLTDPNRFTSLVDQYAEFATSDAVISSLRKQRLLGRRGDTTSGIAALTATSVASPINGSITPLLKISGIGGSPFEATRLTLRATQTFIAVQRARQVKAKIPESQRVELRIVKPSGVPKLVGPRSKTTFIIILMAGLTLTVAAAFIRENLGRAKDQRAKDQSQPEPALVLDRIGREAAPVASTGSEPAHAPAENGTGSGIEEIDLEPDASSGTRTRWPARSSG